MDKKLFDVVKEGHDSKNRIVFICKDASGFYVTKPANGFKSRVWPAEDDPELLASFERQCACGHFHPQYAEADKSDVVADAAATAKAEKDAKAAAAKAEKAAKAAAAKVEKDAKAAAAKAEKAAAKAEKDANTAKVKSAKK